MPCLPRHNRCHVGTGHLQITSIGVCERELCFNAIRMGVYVGEVALRLHALSSPSTLVRTIFLSRVLLQAVAVYVDDPDITAAGAERVALTMAASEMSDLTKRHDPTRWNSQIEGQ